MSTKLKSAIIAALILFIIPLMCVFKYVGMMVLLGFLVASIFCLLWLLVHSILKDFD